MGKTYQQTAISTVEFEDEIHKRVEECCGRLEAEQGNVAKLMAKASRRIFFDRHIKIKKNTTILGLPVTEVWWRNRLRFKVGLYPYRTNQGQIILDVQITDEHDRIQGG